MSAKILVTVVLPEKFEGDYEAFAAAHELEIWHSDVLKPTLRLLQNVRSALIENKPVMAYNSLRMLEDEIKSKISDG